MTFYRKNDTNCYSNDKTINFPIDKYNRTLLDVLKDIEPDKQEKEFIDKVLSEILKNFQKELIERGLNKVEIVVSGSVAKNTYLKGVRDIDVFFLITDDFTIENFFPIFEKIIDKVFQDSEKIKAYAQHPYIQVYKTFKFTIGKKKITRRIRIDIVPSYKITSSNELKSSVDRTQLHTQYINIHLSEERKKEVLLLKQFLKANDLYGAEHKTLGFSGYLCELLILKFGTFLDVLRYFASFKREPLIMPENLILDKSQIQSIETIMEQLSSSTNSAMIFLDPVDLKRNVAAAVSHNSLGKLILLSRAFLEMPSKDFFYSKMNKVSAKSLKKKLIQTFKQRKTYIFGLKFKKPELIDDIFYPQFKKTVNKILTELQLNDFRLFGHYYIVHNDYCYIIIESFERYLPKVKRIDGPDVTFSHALNNFLSSHNDAINFHFERSNIVAIKKRDETNSDVLKLIKKILSDEQIATRIGIPKEIYKSIQKSYKFLDLKKLVKEIPEHLNIYLYGLWSDKCLSRYFNSLRNSTLKKYK
ncbi:MAG: CCA tRNA nucleotidyltransferase [Candidatus Anstonellales archaeon]